MIGVPRSRSRFGRQLPVDRALLSTCPSAYVPLCAVSAVLEAQRLWASGNQDRGVRVSLRPLLVVRSTTLLQMWPGVTFHRRISSVVERVLPTE
jgi:hypothetical protein